MIRSLRTPKLKPWVKISKKQNKYQLLYPEGKASLNKTAYTILTHCDGKNSVNDICVKLELEFNGASNVTEVREFLSLAYDQLWIDYDTSQ